MRADVNLSVCESGSDVWGTRTEMKNLNSFKAITRAIEAERERQIELLEMGRPVIQETRRWDDNKESSRAMRSKEDAKDYRYFPDPDLPPVHISDEWIQRIRNTQPQLREEKQQRYQDEMGLSDYDARVLTESAHLADLFEKTAELSQNPKRTAAWFMGEVLRLIKEYGTEPEKVCFSPKHLARLICMVEEKKVSPANAKKVFEHIFNEDTDPEVFVREHGLGIVQNDDLMQRVVQKVLAENPGPLSELLGGKEKVFGFFVGQMMRELKGTASPEAVRDALTEEINKNRR